MTKTQIDFRSEHLGWVETHLRTENPDLPKLWLTGQSHYSPGGFAFIVVDGVEDDKTRRRSIRADAVKLLQNLGHSVELQPSRDVYNIDPIRPRSQHEAIAMVSELHTALTCPPVVPRS